MRRKRTRAGQAAVWGIAALAALLLPATARADSVTLTWTAPGDDGSSGRAASYELRYSTQPVSVQDTLSWWNSAAPAGTLPQPQSAGARESFTVSGLTTGVVYYFVLRTSDEVPNVSAFSNVRARQAGSGATLATPADFSASSVAGGVLLTWTEPASGSGEGYRIYRRTGASGPDSLVTTQAVGVTSWTDAAVAAGATYEYRIATYQGAVEGTPAVASVTVTLFVSAETATEVHGYPNPARDRVTLRFRAETRDGSPGRARLVVFDLSGHRICQILDAVVDPGDQTIEWTCRSDEGTPIAPGLYNVILDGPQGRSVTRLAIVP